MKGLIIKSTGLWYEAKVEDKVLIARLRGKFKLEDKKLTNPIAVGDWVEVEPNNQVDGEWVIVDIYPRKNYVVRQSPRKKGHDHMLASNIDQGVLIVTLKKPRTSVGFIDRFLITLEAFRIPGIIIFNKEDLYTEKERKLYEELKAIYSTIGYSVHLISLKEENPLHKLPALFEGKVTLISGHSGAGKSTLVNLLSPDARQEINEVSDFANKGVHTTTFAELFEVDSKASIIDTPGIKELGLSEIDDDELSHYFPEMRQYLGACKFHNCIHENEPGCAIKAEVGNAISWRRYESYISILSNEDNRK
ncbi:MAG: ribosome small subunit-dependent GTPase A [Bacteroidota bacterium]